MRMLRPFIGTRKAAGRFPDRVYLIDGLPAAFARREESKDRRDGASRRLFDLLVLSRSLVGGVVFGGVLFAAGGEENGRGENDGE